MSTENKPNNHAIKNDPDLYKASFSAPADIKMVYTIFDSNSVTKQDFNIITLSPGGASISFCI